MNIILYNAVSLDGFIATLEGDSDWVSDVDAEVFEAKCKEAGCILVGRKTFEQFPELYPMDGVENIVLTRDETMSSANERVHFVHSVQEAVEAAEKFEYQTAILAGGSKANSSFLKAGFVNEIYLSVHPLALGEGLKMFGEQGEGLSFKLLDVTELGEGLVLLHYTLVSS